MAASCSGDKAASGGGGDAPGDAGAGGAEEETGHASEVPADVVGAVMLGAVVMGAVVPTGSGGGWLVAVRVPAPQGAGQQKMIISLLLHSQRVLQPIFII